MAKIEYVGKKAQKDDNVAATGTIWDGPGDVQEVPDDKAHLFIAHPGIWRVVGKVPTAPAKALPGKEPPKDIELEDPAVRLDTSRMTKDQLIEVAKRQFNLDLPRDLHIAVMRKSVNDAGKPKGTR